MPTFSFKSSWTLLLFHSLLVCAQEWMPPETEQQEIIQQKSWSSEMAQRLREELDYLDESSIENKISPPLTHSEEISEEWQEDQIHQSQSGLLKNDLEGNNLSEIDEGIDLNAIEKKVGDSILSDQPPSDEAFAAPKKQRSRKRF